MAKDDHKLQPPEGCYYDRDGILRPFLPPGYHIKHGSLQPVPPPGTYYDRDGHLADIPTEPMILEQELRAIARAEKTATLRGKRPSEQEGRDRKARAKSGRIKGGRGR